MKTVTVCSAAALAAGMAAGYALGSYGGASQLPQQDTEQRTDTVWVTRTVTAPELAVRPLPQYILARLERTDTVRDIVRDTVEVRVPVSEYIYADSLCRIAATGFAVRFDTVTVHVPERIHTLTLTRTVTAQPRWSVTAGVTATVTPHGVQPGIGLTAGYVLWSK